MNGMTAFFLQTVIVCLQRREEKLIIVTADGPEKHYCFIVAFVLVTALKQLDESIVQNMVWNMLIEKAVMYSISRCIQKIVLCASRILDTRFL